MTSSNYLGQPSTGQTGDSAVLEGSQSINPLSCAIPSPAAVEFSQVLVHCETELFIVKLTLPTASSDVF